MRRKGRSDTPVIGAVSTRPGMMTPPMSSCSGMARENALWPAVCRPPGANRRPGLSEYGLFCIGEIVQHRRLNALEVARLPAGHVVGGQSPDPSIDQKTHHAAFQEVFHQRRRTAFEIRGVAAIDQL